MHYALDSIKETIFVSLFAWIYGAIGILKVEFLAFYIFKKKYTYNIFGRVRTSIRYFLFEKQAFNRLLKVIAWYTIIFFVCLFCSFDDLLRT